VLQRGLATGVFDARNVEQRGLSPLSRCRRGLLGVTEGTKSGSGDEWR